MKTTYKNLYKTATRAEWALVWN